MAENSLGRERGYIQITGWGEPLENSIKVNLDLMKYRQLL
jgi:hypothetical protein